MAYLVVKRLWKTATKSTWAVLSYTFWSVASVTTYNADASQGPTKQQCEDAYKKLSAGESASLDLRVPVPSVGEIGEFYRCYSRDHKQESETFGYWIIAPPVSSSKFINKWVFICKCIIFVTYELFSSLAIAYVCVCLCVYANKEMWDCSVGRYGFCHIVLPCWETLT